MPDVEVKLNFMADYKAAMAAIAQMGKALEIVQSRAKQILPLANAPQGGGDDTKLMVERKEAVTQLALAMRAAAQTGELMAAALAKLNPVLAEMGPEAEQVQNVAAMGQYYKELAASLGVAAEAAARYKAADGGMKETDERIKRLMDENQKLMDLVSNIREEYTESVRRNAEREKERIMREDNAAALEKEKQKNFDNTYQMKLASMTKRELVAEIRRLTAARKEAAKAGDEFNYQQYGEHLRIARQELRKTTQAQQVNKIAFLQQAQVAQQMGSNLKSITEGVMGFGKALDEGTVNLTGMASAAISMGMAIKAGLGPLGWALAAVEGLTLLWNAYAKKQKEAQKAEEERAKKAQELATAYNDAAEAVQRLADREVDLQKLNDLKQAYTDLNNELRTRNDLLDASLRKLSAELAMRAKDEELEKTLKKNEIMRDYWSGSIDEEERDRRLDELNVTSAEQKRKRTMEKGQAELDAAQARERGALDRLGAATGLRERLRMEKSRMLSPEEIKMLSLEDKKISNLMEEVKGFEALGTGTGNYFANMRRDTLDSLFNERFGISYREFESGRYKEQYNAFNERLKTANAEAESAKANYEAAKAATLNQQSEFAFADAQTKQDVKIASKMLTENATQREAQRQYKNKQEERRRNEQLAKEAERQAERAAREANKMKQLGRDVFVEAEAEGAFGKLTGGTRKFLRDGGMGMLRDRKISEREGERLAELLETARRLQLESLEKLVNEVVNMARDFGQTSDKVLGRLQAEQNKSKKKTKRTID